MLAIKRGCFKSFLVSLNNGLPGVMMCYKGSLILIGTQNFVPEMTQYSPVAHLRVEIKKPFYWKIW
jgi:hypothetical protein